MGDIGNSTGAIGRPSSPNTQKKGITLRGKFRLPSAAMIVALIALFVALSGTATAAFVVTSATIKNGTVQSIDIKNGTVRPADLSSAARQGMQGIPGIPGGFDPAKLQYITGPDVIVLPGEVGSAQANCPAGTAAISGGFFASIANVGFSQTFGQTFHGIAVSNTTGINVTIHATVVCSAN